MAPVPFRGKRNDPGKVLYMAQKLGELWGISTEEAARITLQNGKRLYRIP
jgi:TatD DNase family protein